MFSSLIGSMKTLERYSSCKLPTLYGLFDLVVYRSDKGEEIAVIATEELNASGAPFVRVHSQCFTAEVIGSLKCDCREQLVYALERIGSEKDGGAIIYLPQEGRGIGLGNKVKAYSLQDKGADTLEANHLLGFEGDLRDFNMAAEILTDMGISKVRLNTNNPDKLHAILDAGIEVAAVVPSVGNENKHNKKYLQTKAEKMGHIQLNGIPLEIVKCSGDKSEKP
jgi:GTP cyclohydrolase II